MKHIFLITFLIFSIATFSQNDDRNDYFLAETYYREGEYEKAIQIFKKLYEQNSFNTTYLSRLISSYQETENFDTAEKLIKENIKQKPYQTYFYVYLGYNYQRQQLKEQAKINYDKALTSLHENASFGPIIGRIFKEYNLLDEAIVAYEKTMEKNPNANYSFQIAQIYGEKGDFKKMFEYSLDLVDKDENYLSLIQRYTSRYITEDATNENNILFRKSLLKKAANNPKNEWNVLLSWLFTQQKEYQKALIQEKALYQRNPTELSQIFSLGKIAFDNQDYDAAKECFLIIDEKSFIREEKIAANLYLLKVAVATKNPETEALFQKQFTQFGKNQQTIELQVEYADFLTFTKNNPEKATAVLEEAIGFSTSKFDEASIKLKLGDVLVFQGRFNKALIYFSQIQTQLKNHELAQEARFKVAQTSYFKGDFSWAKAQLKVLKGSTTQLIANDAVALYLKITDNEPVDSIPSGLKQLAKAELLAYQNKDKEALQEISTLFSSNEVFINGLIPGEVIYDDVLFLQAKLLIKQKNYKEAIVSLEKIIAADNQGILTDDVYYLMAQVYENNIKDVEKAQEYYQKIIFEHPSSIFLVDARKKYRKLRGDNI